MFFVKSPFFLKWLYPSLVWKKPAENTIYITFDDGPIPEVTPFVLKCLQEYQAKATFFCIGDNVRKHPEVFRQILECSHAVGNHTFNHLKGWDTDDDVYVDNYKMCQEYINTNLFRPPYGRIKKSQISKLRRLNPAIKIIMWDVLSGDFSLKLTPEECLKNVIENTRPGSIIVFHDSIKAFKRLEYTLPLALKAWKNKGYKMEVL